MYKIVVFLALLVSVPAFAEVTVESPYVRATPPGQKVTGAFMLLNNSGEEDRAVVSADSDVAGIVELHTHELHDGMMQMRQIPQIDIAAGATTTLAPGGLHVMLIDLHKELKVGDAVDIELVLDNGEKIAISAPVKTVTGGMNMKHGMQGDMQQHGMKGGMKQHDMKGDMQHGCMNGDMKHHGMKGDKQHQCMNRDKHGMKGDMQHQCMNGDMKQRGMKGDMQHQCMNGDKKHHGMKHGKGRHDSAKMLMKHVNPVPNYMGLVMKMSDELQLNEEQRTRLDQWQAANKDVVAALAKSIADAEKNLAEQSKEDVEAEAIMQSAEQLMALRLEMIERKTKCRDNLKTILDEAQYHSVLTAYEVKTGF